MNRTEQQSHFYVIIFCAAEIGTNTQAGDSHIRFFPTDICGGHDERWQNAGLTFIENMERRGKPISEKRQKDYVF